MSLAYSLLIFVAIFSFFAFPVEGLPGRATHGVAPTVSSEQTRTKTRSHNAGRGDAMRRPVNETSAEEVSSYFKSICSKPDELRAFLKTMPKGAELHIHLSGIPSPERLLELAAGDKSCRYYVRIPKDGYRADDPAAYALVPVKSTEAVRDSALLTVKALLKPQTDLERHQRVEFCRAMTIAADSKNANDIFCNATFQRRRPLLRTPAVAATIVMDAIRQASSEKIIYLEIQIDPCLVGPFPSKLELEHSISFKSMHDNLLALNHAAQVANASLLPTKRVTARFLISLNRENLAVFKKLPLAFQLASDAGLANCVVGINICGNEYGRGGKAGWDAPHSVTLRKELNKLHQTYPQVRVSMHAGESLSHDHHIRDSILNGADRIGHGTNFNVRNSSCAGELQLMRDRHILFEICPSSENILSCIPYKSNPFLDFLRSSIPVAISSDDPGLFAVDLSEEFARLIETHPQLTWKEIQQLCRNSLVYAFEPPNTKAALLSLWEKQMNDFSLKNRCTKSKVLESR